MPAAARAILLGALCVAGCSPAPPTPTPAPAATATRASADAEGVRFMRDMIVHHAQALELAALVRSRTEREDMHRLAERIEVSQADEVALMRQWLEARGAAASGEHTHHHDPAMPGMLSAAEIAAVAEARGSDFERRFLDAMIRHHEGALTMVASLFESGGANRDVELFRFASDVDADQRAEIARMRRLLASFPR